LIAGGVELGVSTTTDKDDDSDGEQGGDDKRSGCDELAVVHV